MRPIDADALKQDMYEQVLCIYDVDKIIDEAPTIEPPVVRGEWIEINKHGGICGNCRTLTKFVAQKPTKYCSNCGADMRGANE